MHEHYVMNTMLVYHFVDADLGVELFFGVEGATD